MNFKRWKLGLFIALLSGLLNGIIGWAIDVTLKQALVFAAIAIAKDGLLYLAKHPVESIQDTAFITRVEVPEPPLPPK